MWQDPHGICALNYSSTRAPLACEADGHAMFDLAQACGAHSVQVLHDEQCTRDNIARVMRYVGMQCGPDDYVIFYFSGRSMRLTGTIGRGVYEESEQVLCLVDHEGQVSPQSFLPASELSDIVTATIPQDARMVIVTESPHIVDVSKEDWRSREVISLAGCTSKEASFGVDTSSGGAFTHSILLAVERLQQLGEYDYSVGMLYNTALEECSRVFNNPCDLVIQPSAATACHEIAWPLIPQGVYKAPLTRVASVADRDAEDRLSADAKVLATLGIRPNLLQTVRATAVNVAIKSLQPAYAESVDVDGCTCM